MDKMSPEQKAAVGIMAELESISRELQCEFSKHSHLNQQLQDSHAKMKKLRDRRIELKKEARNLFRLEDKEQDGR